MAKLADGTTVTISTGLTTYTGEVKDFSKSGGGRDYVDLHHLGSTGLRAGAVTPSYDGGEISLKSLGGAFTFPGDTTLVTVTITPPGTGVDAGVFTGFIMGNEIAGQVGGEITYSLRIKVSAQAT
jgi:hypothetical protein